MPVSELHRLGLARDGGDSMPDRANLTAPRGARIAIVEDDRDEKATRVGRSSASAEVRSDSSEALEVRAGTEDPMRRDALRMGLSFVALAATVLAAGCGQGDGQGDPGGESDGSRPPRP